MIIINMQMDSQDMIRHGSPDDHCGVTMWYI